MLLKAKGIEGNKAIHGLNLRSSAYRAESAEIPDDFKHALSCDERFYEIEAFAARMTTDMLVDKLASRGWLMLKECTSGAKVQRKMIKKLAMDYLISAFSSMSRVGPRLFQSQTASLANPDSSLASRTTLCDHMWMSLSRKERAAWCSVSLPLGVGAPALASAAAAAGRFGRAARRSSSFFTAALSLCISMRQRAHDTHTQARAAGLPTSGCLPAL